MEEESDVKILIISIGDNTDAMNTCNNLYKTN